MTTTIQEALGFVEIDESAQNVKKSDEKSVSFAVTAADDKLSTSSTVTFILFSINFSVLRFSNNR